MWSAQTNRTFLLRIARVLLRAPKFPVTSMMENHMKKKMEHETENVVT